MTRLEKVRAQAEMAIVKINDWVAAVEMSEAADKAFDDAWESACKEAWETPTKVAGVNRRAILCEREEAEGLVVRAITEVLSAVTQMRVM